MATIVETLACTVNWRRAMASQRRRLAPSSMASKMTCVPLRCMSATACVEAGSGEADDVAADLEALELEARSG